MVGRPRPPADPEMSNLGHRVLALFSQSLPFVAKGLGT